LKSNSKKGCLFVLLGGVITLAIVGVALFFGFKYTVEPYLNQLGIGSVNELLDITNALNENVTESELITGDFTEGDYGSAKAKLLISGIDIFDDATGNVDLNKIGATESFLPTLSASLTSAELGALIFNTVKYLSGNLISDSMIFAVTLISFNVTYIDDSSATVEYVVKLNTGALSSEIGLMQSFIPSYIYVTVSSTVSLTGGLNITTDSIKINQLSPELNETVLNVLCNIINIASIDITEYTPANLKEKISTELESRANMLLTKIIGTLLFNEYGISLNLD